ncbi:hypothetical protein [Ottowia sp.]|uniref:hypothetical protein n=1 Tax=Ottowia sp. TaxID=1898956 RepID=UPI0025CF294B|nr:hypothetical protein [Ottowia sp.]MBK6616514.1 hypothetical protein [Ottowia sp.]
MCTRKEVASLDVAYALRFGCFPDAESALTALHQHRYDRVDMPADLRRESEQWMKLHGHVRLNDLAWPDDGSLPN